MKTSCLIKTSVFLVMTTGGLLSCNGRGSNTADNNNQADSAISATVIQVKDTSQPDTGNEKIEDFRREWNKKLDKLDEKIQQKKEKIKDAGSEQRVKLDNQIDEMKKKKKEIQDELDEAGNQTAENWDRFKKKVSDQYETLEKKVNDFLKDDQ